MEPNTQNKQHQAFQEGTEDNTVKITDDNNADPKQDVLNRDPRITNQQARELVTEDLEGKGNDGEALENTVDNEKTNPEIPDIHSPSYEPGKTNRELPELNEED